MKYICSCCGFRTLESTEEYEICPVCFWEKDLCQENNPDLPGGANKESLNVSRKNFLAFGACEKKFSDKVRKPGKDEII